MEKGSTLNRVNPCYYLVEPELPYWNPRHKPKLFHVARFQK